MQYIVIGPISWWWIITLTKKKNRTVHPEAHLDQEQQSLKPPISPHRPWFFLCREKPWYITGDEGCGQVLSKLCVLFRRREQISILRGQNPSPVDPFNEHKFWCGQHTFVRHQIWSLWPSFIKILCLVQAIMTGVSRFTDWLTYGHRLIA